MIGRGTQAVAGVILIFVGVMVAMYPQVKGEMLMAISIKPSARYDLELRQNDSWIKSLTVSPAETVALNKSGGSIIVDLQYIIRWIEEDRNWVDTEKINFLFVPRYITWRDTNGDSGITPEVEGLDKRSVDLHIDVFTPEPKTYTLGARAYTVGGDAVHIPDATGILTACIKVLKPPTIDFTWSPSNPDTQTTITFTASIVQGDGSITDILWDFGNDGSIDASGTSVNKMLIESGSIGVKLIVRDSKGYEITKVKNVNVILAKQDPIIRKVYTDPPRPVQFDYISIIADAYDPDGNVAGYKWKVSKDGNVKQETNWQTSHILSFSFDVQGTWTIELWIKDTDERTNYTKVFINVGEYSPPIADFIAPTRGYVGAPVTIADNSSYSATIISRKWTIDGENLEDNDKVIGYTFENSGYHSVGLTIEDTHGNSDTKLMQIYIYETVPNQKPAVNFEVSPSTTVNIGTPISFNNQTYDPDGDKVSYVWYFGDNTSSTETHPAKIYTEEGYYAVKLSATDELGAQENKIVYITVERPRYTINGFAFDKKTGGKLAGVMITLESPELGEYRVTFTNEYGYYSFDNIPEGVYRVSVEKEGYASDIKYYTFKRNTQLNVVLEQPLLAKVEPFIFLTIGGMIVIIGLATIVFAVMKPATVVMRRA